ncbi:MAG: HAMP domain-containing histidine kinase, partial [Acidobacteriia bacterium]|nr:HAMP domain-containing histidine kinase [Terriglobia bacterium]
RTRHEAEPANGCFGLGLSIVKWIAEAHQGVVTLRSRLGDGSTFTVRFPRPDSGSANISRAADRISINAPRV